MSVYFCTVLFVSISQVIGCEDRLRYDLYCVEWGVKLYSNKFLYLALADSAVLMLLAFSVLHSAAADVVAAAATS